MFKSRFIEGCEKSSDMIFKSGWEKVEEYLLLDEDVLQGILNDAFPNEEIEYYDIVSGGCANFNVKINRLNDSEPLLLRIYNNGKSSNAKERNISKLIEGIIPCPNFKYIGNFDGKDYAVVECVNGQTLRDVILKSDHDTRIYDVVYEAGIILAKMQQFRFETSGFFDKNLNVVTAITKSSHIDFIEELLCNDVVMNVFSLAELNKIKNITNQYQDYWPDFDNPHLVHGDYDPSNILVSNCNGKLKISAVLDWEFAYAGSFLQDVANMLRYSNHVPKEYEQSFLNGIDDGGIELPENWRKTAHLLNLLSLLDCTARSNINTQPKRLQDIKALVGEIVVNLES